jgi:hypothetical protein
VTGCALQSCQRAFDVVQLGEGLEDTRSIAKVALMLGEILSIGL